MFNQLSGINAILYYLNDIFNHAGFSKVSGNLQAVAIGATNLLFTMIAMSVIDKLGRKTLLLVGSVGTAFCLAGVSIIFFTGQHQSLLVWLLVGYIAFFAFSRRHTRRWAHGNGAGATRRGAGAGRTLSHLGHARDTRYRRERRTVDLTWKHSGSYGSACALTSWTRH